MREQTKTLTLLFNERDVADYFEELKNHDSYPILQGDPLLLIYNLLRVLNIPEKKILEWIGPWGYLHIAHNRFLDARCLEDALECIIECATKNERENP